MSKKILILGAGLMQKPAIMTAKKLGYTAVVVDANPNAVCVPLADRFEPIDLKDKEALVRFSDELNSEGGENGLAAVFTAGTDFSASVAYVAQHCGFPCHSYESCLNASDKIRMRGCFKAAHVPSPAFIEIDGAQIASLSSLAERDLLEFPKVVKPVDNMGARGCRLVRGKEEFLGAVQDAVRYSRSGRAIFEDYMDGPEFSIDSIVWNGTLTITGFADRHIYYPPYFIEIGHTMPTIIDDKMKKELIACFALGIKSLGLSCGVAKADIKYTKNGPMIGEIAARLSGGYMSGWTYPYASDCNLTEQAMLVALGKTPEYLVQNRVQVAWAPHPSCAQSGQPFELFDLPCARVSAERAWMSIPGKAASVIGLEEAKKVSDVRDVLPRTKAGDTVTFPRNNVEKCGNIIAVAPDRPAAEKAAYDAIRNIVVRLEPNNRDTDNFIAGKIEKGERGFPPPAFAVSSESPSQDGSRVSCSASYERIGEGTIIPAGKKVLPLLPESLQPLADSVRDWNHKTLRETLAQFDELCGSHCSINGAAFWHALIQGGIQGALYAADCAALNNKTYAATL